MKKKNLLKKIKKEAIAFNTLFSDGGQRKIRNRRIKNFSEDKSKKLDKLFELLEKAENSGNEEAAKYILGQVQSILNEKP